MDYARTLGSLPRSTVAAPIFVAGRVWGSIFASTMAVAIAEGTETRVVDFAELVATAIANTEARRELEQVAAEQRALRTAATLVASGASPSLVFSAITVSASELFEVPFASLLRYGSDEKATMVAGCSACSGFVGQTWAVPADDPGIVRTVVRSRQPARIEDHSGVHGPLGEAARSLGIGSVVGVPVVVDGSVWGVLAIGAAQDGPPLPADASDRLVGFTELVTTALINAETRDSLHRLADEQAALRRVATLAARESSSPEILEAIAEEAARILEVDAIGVLRFEPNDTATLVAQSETPWDPVPRARVLRSRVRTSSPRCFALDWPPGWTTGRVPRVRSPPWLVSWVCAPPSPLRSRSMDGSGARWSPPRTKASLCWPIQSRDSWSSPNCSRLRSRTRRRREALIASRARIVAAGDEARRRIERNLHDGTQQRLVAICFNVETVRESIPADQQEAQSGLKRLRHDLEAVIEDVRELSQGLHPAILSQAGLGPSLQALARRSPIPVKLGISVCDRPSESTETAAYYVISEALANAAKHARASEISVAVTTSGTEIRAIIEDDGCGGADVGAGSGLLGLIDRIEALGGRFALDSPPGRGTRISIEMPLTAEPIGEVAPRRAEGEPMPGRR